MKLFVNITATVATLVASMVADASPYELSFTGRIVDESGAGIQTTVDLDVWFYSEAAGGAPILDGAVEVNGVVPKQGIVSFGIPLTDGERSTVLGGAGDVYVEVIVRGTGRSLGRMRMSATPYALRVPVDGVSLSFGTDGKLKLGAASATYTLPATPQAGRYLTTDAGGNLAWGEPSGAGDITGVSAGTGLTGGAAAGNATLAVDVGTTAGKIVQIAAGDRLPAVDGSQLTMLNASNLTSGTIPAARLPAALPALSGASLTSLNASALGSGTIPDARFPATLPAASGINLTDLDATDLGSGTIPDGRFPATLPAVSGANLTSLNANQITSGTVAKSRGGSGQDNSSLTFPASGALALDPTTTQGDLSVRGAASLERLAIGANGSVLTSNGSSLVYLYPEEAKRASLVEHHDDWIAGAVASEAGWLAAQTGTGAGSSVLAAAPVDENHPGILQLSTGTTATGYAAIHRGVGSMLLGGAAIVQEWLVRVPTLSDGTNTYVLRIGLGDSTTGTAHTDGVFFEYSSAVSPNWQIRTRANNADTTTASSTSVTAGAWVKLRLEINAPGTSVTFYVNGSAIGTHSANIPLGAGRQLGPIASIIKTVGTTARLAHIDYYYQRMVLSTPR
jgi:hypothetical protein